MTIIEICVEDTDGVVAATEGGADRVELCRDVSCGGLTPSLDLIAEALEQAPDGGMQILIRSRPGDFCYLPQEIDAMCEEIGRIRELSSKHLSRGPLGFTVGAVSQDSTIDKDATEAFVAAAQGAPLTFHRGFDQVNDRSRALEFLIDCGFTAVLTTGGHPSVAQIAELKALVDQAGSRLVILGSGGLRAHNVADVISRANLREVHMRAPFASGHGTDIEQVQRIVNAVRGPKN